MTTSVIYPDGRLESRGLLGGCTCGCRGDWHPSDECDDPVYCCPPRTLAP